MHSREEKMEAFGRFLDILDELRVKCPWDRKQTNESLRPNTIEETYELCDALIRDDKMEICKELGDVLLHVAFYAKIGSETGDFDIKDVCDRLCDKLIFRHPHVFGNAKAETAGQVVENWEQLKLKEKGGNKTVLSGVPQALPSLINGAAIATTTLLGYSAMAGICGGGGLGAIAINYGYYRGQVDIMLVMVLILVLIVQLIQMLGERIAKCSDKRIR